MKHLTFSTKSLTKLQIEFLTAIEKAFFKKENIDRGMLETGMKSIDYTPERASEILEVWEYWNFMPKPLIRSSYKTKVNLDTLLLDGGLFWLKDGKKDKVKPSAKLKRLLKSADLMYQLSPSEFYFEIIKGALYIKYQHIIGSRFIAYVK